VSAESESAGLADHLRRRIRLEGPLSVATFMADSLAHPQHGYYIRGRAFGRAGDFTTAPEISQMFGELIGLWCADTWQRLGAPEAVHLVELGPGRGSLMADALRATRGVAGFHAAVDLHLVEISPALCALQKEALAGVGWTDATWHTALSTLPAGPIILVANEFFDALPIHQFVLTETGWRERMIAADDQHFTFVLASTVNPLSTLLDAIAATATLGDIAEISPASLGIAATIGHRVGTSGGAALIIDYGSATGAHGDSLQAVRRHRPSAVLDRPGSADITAHVDFMRLAEAAAAAGAIRHGPIDQGDFLRRLGIMERADQLLAAATPAQTLDITSARDRLILPTKMGTLFKALTLAQPDLTAPAGFDDG
jgi:NADH dehydrogenase [ubiquinone] 1 alpha subcomplex assembly factor 7